MLLTAPSGWGKTPFAGSTDGVLIISVDPEGTDSAAFAGSTADEWVVRSREEWDLAVQYMRKEGCNEYKWLVIDSITELQRLLMKTQLATREKRGKQDPDVPELQDYMKNQIQIIDIVKVVNDLPINVLWTALDMVITRSDGEDRIYPMIHGGKGDVAKQVRGYMKVIASGEIIDDEESDRTRRMWFIHKDEHMGRDRTGALGDSQDDLTLKKLEVLLARKRKETLAAASSPAARTTAAPRKKATATPVRRPVKKTS